MTDKIYIVQKFSESRSDRFLNECVNSRENIHVYIWIYMYQYWPTQAKIVFKNNVSGIIIFSYTKRNIHLCCVRMKKKMLIGTKCNFISRIEFLQWLSKLGFYFSTYATLTWYKWLQLRKKSSLLWHLSIPALF